MNEKTTQHQQLPLLTIAMPAFNEAANIAGMIADVTAAAANLLQRRGATP